MAKWALLAFDNRRTQSDRIYPDHFGFNSEVAKEGSVEEKVSSTINEEREQELRNVLKGKMEQTGMRVAYKIRQAGNLKV